MQTGRVTAVLEWDGEHDIDLAAALLGPEGRVLREDDFVFYNQPVSGDGSLRSSGRAVTERGLEERVVVDLPDVPPEIVGLGFAAAADSLPPGDHAVRFVVLDATGARVSEAELTVDGGGAVLVGAMTRLAHGWEVKHAGDVVPDGMAGLATLFGVAVEADDSGGDPAVSDGTEETDPEPAFVDEVAVVGDDDIADVDSEFDAQEVSTDVEALPAMPSAVRSAPLERKRAVRTKAARTPKVLPPQPRLAEGDHWVPARLFSVSGVGSAGEQEKRATSALLATAAGVKAFGRGFTALAAAPAGAVETFIEVPFDLGATKVIPDGVIKVARGSRSWTALLEVKTGTGQLRTDQVEAYLDVAKANEFDAVITLSNEISPGAGEHPVAVDKRKLRKTALVHISWAEVLHEAQMTLNHRGVADPVQAWVLNELIRYLQHPRSGASGFQDMGGDWVAVRDAVHAGTLRASDPRASAVVDSWSRLTRHLTLGLTAELGVVVSLTQSRKASGDAKSRQVSAVQSLVEEGVLLSGIKVPGAAGQLQLTADLRTSQVRVGVQIQAPREGGSQRRLSWLLRQLTDAPDDVVLEVGFPGRAENTRALLREARESTASLLGEAKSEVLSFRLTRTTAMGTKRSGVKGAFIPSVSSALEDFYKLVLQPIRAWVPPAPKLPEEAPPLDGLPDSV